MATRKKVFNVGDRFSHSGGWGFVIEEGSAILFGPKKGRDSKYVYADDIPDDAKAITKCPEPVKLALDALECMLVKRLTELVLEEAQNN